MKAKPILLVEDDERLRDALAETLRLAGFEVLLAADGGAALQVLASAPIAAVVTDYQMKPMDGSTLLARIRDRLPQLPVLMIDRLRQHRARREFHAGRRHRLPGEAVLGAGPGGQA